MLISNDTAQVVARSASGIIAAAAVGNANWELNLEIVENIPEVLSLESAENLRRITLSGETVPLGGMLRLVNQDGHRILPLLGGVDEGGNSFWLIDVSAMEEGVWSIRFLGAGRWTSFSGALSLYDGELELRASLSRPEIDLELEFIIPDSEGQRNQSITEDDGCDCAGFAPSGLGWLVLLWVGARRRRQITQ